MKQTLTIFFFQLFILQSCLNSQVDNKTEDINEKASSSPSSIVIIKKEGKNVETRFYTPSNYKRKTLNENSFQKYLRSLPLKPYLSEVLLYNGETKYNFDVYEAVVDMKIGKKDLHQCADAIMRLRAEYLWNQQKYDQIHFNFTNGFQVDYEMWRNGNRMVVEGNKTYWKKTSSPSNTYQDFWKYMELIFTYSGTMSLSKELKPVNMDDIEIGDIFIQGGSPGHAIIVVDMAINEQTNDKVFILAQSYMPAQEIQILKNNNNTNINPWYSLTEIKDYIQTPEWTFTVNDLKRFK